MLDIIVCLSIHTRVKLDTVTEVLDTNIGIDLAAYFLPANATMNPPAEAYKIVHLWWYTDNANTGCMHLTTNTDNKTKDT